MNITLKRTKQNNYATYGEMHRDDGSIFCLTLELPWRDNQHKISCIPAGIYQCSMRDSVSHGMQLYGVNDVPNRSDVEIHWGNYPRDFEGCIGVGTFYSDLDADGNMELANSKSAFTGFMAMQGGNPFTLTITDPQEVV